MKNAQIELAKSHEREIFYQQVKEVLINPAVAAIAGIILVEYLQSSVDNAGRRKAGGGWMGETVGTALQGSLAAYMLAPSVGKVAADIKPMFDNIAVLGKLVGG